MMFMIPWKDLAFNQRVQLLWTIAKVMFSLSLVACTVAPAPVPVDNGQAIVSCETTGHNLCAHCCEPQPYVDETKKNGTMFTRPIEACSASPLPSSWTVAWCMSDCSAEVDNSCQPGAQ